MLVESFAAARDRAAGGSIIDAGASLPFPAWILLFAGSAALVWRRRRPIVVLAVVVGAYAVWHLFGYDGGPSLAILMSMYGVGRYIAEFRTSLTLLVVAAATFVVVGIFDGDSPADLVLAATFIPILPWYVGRRVTGRREYLRLLEERAELLERERAAEIRQALDEERRNIARELHDVVAHRVSLMTVQAGAAQAILDDDPGRAAKAMTNVEDAGRAALDELRHLLDVLGPRSGDQPRTPAASVTDLPKIAEQMAQAGLSVSLEIGEIPDGLPKRVDLSAFRIVQESLTNSLRHAGPGATATVRVGVADRELHIEVVDDGVGRSPWTGGSGRGLAGMRERVELLDGTFQAGPAGQGGYRVKADIPLKGPKE
jgi:signal transduction histidine kinase